MRQDLRLRERLRALYPKTSGRRLKQWLDGARVRVNGVVVSRGDAPVGPADRVDLDAAAPAAVPAPLRLVHEDEHLVVVDKPPGLLTIATEAERERTVYRLLGDWVRARGGPRIFVVHRLDRETSGLLVFAKSLEVKRALQAQFNARTPERVYVARVEGVVREPQGTLTSSLVEDRALRVRTARDGRHGKEAITRYRVLERSRGATLLELALVTGRRGQIRAQLAARGHPIVGDRAYGSRRDPLGRVCLHATRLGFIHPTGRRVVFESPPPSGFRRA
ncbi:MAG: RluA family pseudouridine synthase [Candidatus Rokuibacteriota bacterium]|nr:MAG: RluA family pseudouridine synthase [Candidatus Rokubacteria bacterium]